MSKMLMFAALAGVFYAASAQAAPCDGVPAATAMSPTQATPAPMAQAQRTPTTRSYSYAPNGRSFSYAGGNDVGNGFVSGGTVVGNGRYSFGLRSAGSKANGNYTPYRPR